MTNNRPLTVTMIKLPRPERIYPAGFPGNVYEYMVAMHGHRIEPDTPPNVLVYWLRRSLNDMKLAETYSVIPIEDIEEGTEAGSMVVIWNNGKTTERYVAQIAEMSSLWKGEGTSAVEVNGQEV